MCVCEEKKWKAFCQLHPLKQNSTAPSNQSDDFGIYQKKNFKEMSIKCLSSIAG